MVITLIISLLAVAALLLLLWLLRGAMLVPVRLKRGENLYLVLRTQGEAPELEHTVDGLRWLVENGTLPARIVIQDAGLDTEAREVAELLEKRHAYIMVQAAAEENTWEKRST